jgi:hypothetical protein
LKESLSFTADLGGRYYIIIESVEGTGTFSLAGSVTSPPWNQEWSWYILDTVFVVVISIFFLIKKGLISNLEKASRFAFFTYFCWLITINIFISIVISFTYEILADSPLFYLLIFFCTLSFGMQIYASRLDRRKRIVACHYCGKEIDIQEKNYCCGHIVKNISFFWFLVPLLLSFLLFSVSSFFAWVLPLPLDAPLVFSGFGAFIGGTMAWWVNKKLQEIRPWKFLVEGAVLSLISPLLIVLLGTLILTPNIDVELLGKMTRIRIAPLTLSIGMALPSILLALLLDLLIVNHLKKVVFNKKSL